MLFRSTDAILQVEIPRVNVVIIVYTYMFTGISTIIQIVLDTNALFSEPKKHLKKYCCIFIAHPTTLLA